MPETTPAKHAKVRAQLQPHYEDAVQERHLGAQRRAARGGGGVEAGAAARGEAGCHGDPRREALARCRGVPS